MLPLPHMHMHDTYKKFMEKTILVTGGAGYIGSHTVLELLQHNYRVVVIDKSCRYQINNPRAVYFQCDIAHSQALKAICARYPIDAVIHCAAYIQVGESITNPAGYYDNNVVKTAQFLETMRTLSIARMVFSSSAAVYGYPQTLPITEQHPCAPVNPYGQTKRIVEQMLHDYHGAYGLEYIALRYFNAAGGYPEYQLGERHQPETHLIPLVLQAALENRPCTIFGSNYPTPDGTCVRDYVHVRDIARAHRLALEYFDQPTGLKAEIFNLGTARGFSVLEIIQAVEALLQKKLSLHYAPARTGDPAYLIADATHAARRLGWQPMHSDIMTIVSSALQILVTQYQHNFDIVYQLQR